jgi:hypothetical protein
VVLRSWEPELSLENEFRVFIFRGRITAVSQYDHYMYFPHLAHNANFRVRAAGEGRGVTGW